MTLIGANGTEIGHRRSCAEEFIAPYLMLLEDRIMTSPETNSFGMLRPQSEDLNSLLSPSRGNNGGNYGGGGSGGYNSIGGNSYYPSPTHTHPSSGRFHDIASDQPQPQFEVMSQEKLDFNQFCFHLSILDTAGTFYKLQACMQGCFYKI